MIDFLKKINWEEKIFSLSFSVFGAILFVFFWVYGFFGALSSGGVLKNTFFFILGVLLFFFFLVLWAKKSPVSEWEISFSRGDMGVLFLLFLVLFSLSFSSLALSVVNDGLAHAQQSQIHALSFVYLISARISALDFIPLWILLWGIHIFTLLSGIFILIKLKKWSVFLKASIFLIVFLAFRLLITQLGGSGSPHPPFRLFPLWFSSSLFSPSDFSFRFAQFLGLIFFGWALWRITKNKLGRFSALLFSFAAITIPVLWHTGTLVEQSVWAACAISFTLVFLWVKKETQVREFLALIALISIATVMRQSSFVAFFPIFISLGFAVWKKNISLRDAFFVSTPVLLCAPFLFHSFLFGTSATYVPGEISYIAPDASALSRVWYALQSGLIWTAIKNSVEWVWIFFALVPFLFSLKNFQRFLALLALLSSALFIFYSVRPGLWGIGRYQAEYVIPFAILGLFIFFHTIQNFPRFSRIFSPIIFGVLILMNVFQFLKIPESNASVEELTRTFPEKIKERGKYRALSEFPYAYGKALRAARAEGYAGAVYVAGSTYGIFPNILAGTTVSETRTLKKILGESEFRSDSDLLLPEAIHENMRIQLVFISDAQNKEVFASDLKKLGWREWRFFENTRYQSRILGLIRN